MRMLQQGNLNPAQQAAALASVRAGSGTNSGKDAAPGQPPPPQQQQPQLQQSAPPPPPQYPPTKFKVEYIPARRDISTHGGWDLDLAEAELGPLAKGFGKQPRTVRELGPVDIAGLTLSLRSRLETEVTYALNCLLILSSGSGIRPDMFHVSLAHCGDLLDELVELLEVNALRASEGGPENTESDDVIARFELGANGTHGEWVQETLLEEETARVWKRRQAQQRSISEPVENNEEGTQDNSTRLVAIEDGDAYRKALNEERLKDRQVDVALTILDVLRNFASMSENIEILAKHKALLRILGCLVTRDKTTFTSSELLRVRKDVLFIVAAITGPALKLQELPVATTSAFFDLFCAFILDAASIENLAGLIYEYPPPPPGIPAHLAPRSMPVPWAPKVPHYADMALDGLARFAQPDANRLVLSRRVPEYAILKLAHELVKMLPCSELDFTLFRTEARLSYTEHIAMCLYGIVFLAPSPTKIKLRNAAGWVSTIFRVVKRTSKQHQQQQQQPQAHGPSPPSSFTQNPFSCLIYRLVEVLKLVDECRDMFDQHPLLSGGGSGAGSDRGGGGASSGRSGHEPLLAFEEPEVLQLLSMPGMDPVLVGHLSSMVAV